MSQIHQILLLTLLVAPSIYAYSSGAPAGACFDMVPQHHVDPQSSDAPYNVLVAASKVRAGDFVDVRIQGKTSKDTIKGFMVQARVGETPVGQFQVKPNDQYVQTVDCGNGKNNAVTHRKIEGDGPNSVTFTWVSPRGLSEEVTFRATIALNGGVFWVGKLSPAVKVL